MGIYKRIRKLACIICNKIIFRINDIEYSKGIQINGILMCIIDGDGAIQIGEGSRINSAKWVNIIGGDTRTILSTKDCGKINIGRNVGISNTAIVARKNVRIEDNVLIGGGCKIYDNDFHSLDYTQRIEGFSGIQADSICIKEGAFIGAHSIILKGVTIGKKSIIGAGSVVTKSIPDGEIWAGNPAKYIKKVEI